MTALDFNTQLVDQSKPLKSFALKLTQNIEDANDLLQDTLVKAMTYRDKFTDATNLKAWLFTIMKNTFINNYRRSVRKRTILTEAEEVKKSPVMNKVSDDYSDANINLKEITHAIDDLEEEYKVPFTKHVEGFKYQEISEELDLPIGTVKSRIFVARKKLMDKLKDFMQ